jgi:hypothetical protein
VRTAHIYIIEITDIQSLFPYPVDRTQISQVKLNIGYGGLGLRGTYEHHCAAFLASISSAILASISLIGSFYFQGGV